MTDAEHLAELVRLHEPIDRATLKKLSGFGSVRFKNAMREAMPQLLTVGFPGRWKYERKP